MSEESARGDVASEILETLAPPAESSWERLVEATSRLDTVESRRGREYVETFAALGYATDPVAPSAEVKERLLARLSGDATQIVAPADLPERQSPGPVEAVTRRPADDPGSAARPTAPPRRRRGIELVAAVLAVCALGLAGLSYWLWGELEHTEERLAEQRQALERTTAAFESVRSERADLMELERQLRAAEERLGLVTATATELCALYPPEEQAPMPAARGILYIGSDHQHWYLRAVGLRPLDREREGRSYQLWFVPIDGDREGAVSAGTFDVGPDEEIELSSERMPPTRAVLVTIEPEGGAERPTGPTVLYGEETMTVL